MLLTIAAVAQVARLGIRAFELAQEQLIGGALDKAYPGAWLLVGADEKIIGLAESENTARSAKQLYDATGIVAGFVVQLPANINHY